MKSSLNLYLLQHYALNIRENIGILQTANFLQEASTLAHTCSHALCAPLWKATAKFFIKLSNSKNL